MIELSPLTLLILGEFFVALLAISGGLVFLALTRKERIRQAAHHLSERVLSDRPQRMVRLKRLLSERYGYAGSELDKVLHHIIQTEMILFQNLINGSLKDDPLSLQQIDVDVENLVLAYHALKSVQQPPATQAAADESDELLHLREENQRLSDELRVTMDTMGRMLNEYSSMFAGGSSSLLVRERPESAGADAHEPPISEAQAKESGYTGMETEDIEIPPYSLGEGGAGSRDDSLLDDEMSEIIDEVMGIADEMNHGEEPEEEPTVAETLDRESLADEVSGVDIEIEGEKGAGPDGETPAQGSLEEEWAKLLEEDAASKSDKGS